MKTRDELIASHVDLLGREGSQDQEAFYLMDGRTVQIGDEVSPDSFNVVVRDIQPFLASKDTRRILNQKRTVRGFSTQIELPLPDDEDQGDGAIPEEEEGLEDKPLKELKSVLDAALYLEHALMIPLFSYEVYGWDISRRDREEGPPVGIVKQAGNRLVMVIGEGFSGGMMGLPGAGVEGGETLVVQFRVERGEGTFPVLVPEIEFVLEERDVASVSTYLENGEREHRVGVYWTYLWG